MDALAVDQLPSTATEIATWAIIAIALAILVVGGIVLIVSRRRRARAVDASEPTPSSDTGPDA